ncbi:MAG: hypothetical protein ACI8ZN_001878 [Bacteroidia bacterium]|jgi:hypothetical protein
MKQTICLLLASTLCNTLIAQSTREVPYDFKEFNTGQFIISTSNGGYFIATDTPLTSAFMDKNAGSAKSMIFNSSVWIGGLDETGDLHLAAMTYRQNGHDFFPGPVSADSLYSSKPDFD